MVIINNMATVCILLTCTVIQLAAASPVNVALDKPASMSSNKIGYRASTAVDGNTDAEGFDINQIIDTGPGHPSAWWKVDLQREVQDATMRIYYRTDYKPRRNGVKLYTSTSPFPESNPTSQGQLCDTVTGDPSGSDIPDVYSVTCPGRWRYLLLFTDTDNVGDGPVLDFGEVQVLACSEGTYGKDCTMNCSSRNCVTMTTTCERDGRCPDGCQSGWTGMDCTQECDSDHYGPSCAPRCTDRQCLDDSSLCDHVTGQCVGGCQAGYKELDCTRTCSPGVSYGVDCEKSCTDRHCVTSQRQCDSQTGQCPGGCESGWTGVDCTSAASNGKEPGVTLLVGAVVGTFLVVVLLGVGIIICLIRQGRLKWINCQEEKNNSQESRDLTQMSSIAPRSADEPEHAQSSNHVYNNDYSVLAAGTNEDDKHYDVIQPTHYQNL